MKDRLVKIPGNHKSDYHKDENYSVSRKVKGQIKFVKFNHKHNETELRIAVAK